MKKCNVVKVVKAVKKLKKPGKLAHEMASEVSILTRIPSDPIDTILDSFLDQERAEVLRKKIYKMTYNDVIKLVNEVDELLDSGFYD